MATGKEVATDDAAATVWRSELGAPPFTSDENTRACKGIPELGCYPQRARSLVLLGFAPMLLLDTQAEQLITYGALVF